VLLACFGIRPKIKPFSGTVVFEDQSRSNPVPEEDDPAGSVVDGLILSEYIFLAAKRNAGRGVRSMTVMAARDLDRMLILPAPQQVPARITAEEFTAFALRWLATEH